MRTAMRFRPWVSVFRWPLFTILAGLHLFVLPDLLSEPGQRTVSMVAGVLYVVLVLADLSLGPVGKRGGRPG